MLVQVCVLVRTSCMCYTLPDAVRTLLADPSVIVVGPPHGLEVSG